MNPPVFADRDPAPSTATDVTVAAERPRRSPSRLNWALRGVAGRTEASARRPLSALARPRRMRGSARAVLLWSLLFYTAAAAVLNAVMDHWCPNSPERVYRTKWQGLCRLAREEADRPLVVLLGSSRADGNFQAGRLDGLPGPDGRPLAAYNFGARRSDRSTSSFTSARWSSTASVRACC